MMTTDVPQMVAPFTFQWSLASSSGRERFGGTFVEERKRDERTLLLTMISVTGTFWRAPEFEDRDQETAQGLSLDFVVSLPQLVLDKSQLEYLCSELDNWLHNPKEISIDLSGDAHQKIDISIGAKDTIISSLDKPVFSLSYAAGSFEVGMWHFVVDQSCIRIFLDELRLALG